MTRREARQAQHEAEVRARHPRMARLILALAGMSGADRPCSYAYGHVPRNDRLMPRGRVGVDLISCHDALRAIATGRFVGNVNLYTRGWHCDLLSESTLLEGSSPAA